MTTVGESMKPQARAEFQSVLGRYGVERRALADAAGVSIKTIDALANPKAYNREGTTRYITAWKIADAFAGLSNQTKEDAYNQLFEDVNE